MRRALALAMLIAIPAAPAGATTPRQKVHRAIARGPNAVQALVHQAYVAHRARALGARALDRALMDGARTNATVARALLAPGYSGAVESNAPPLGPVIPDTPTDPPMVPRSAPVKAHAASTCEVHDFWVRISRKGNSIRAQGLVGSNCSGVRGHTAGGYLEEKWYSDNQWHVMASGYGKEVGAGHWSWAYPTKKCRRTSGRYWKLIGWVSTYSPSFIEVADNDGEPVVYIGCTA